MMTWIQKVTPNLTDRGRWAALKYWVGLGGFGDVREVWRVFLESPNGCFVIALYVLGVMLPFTLVSKSVESVAGRIGWIKRKRTKNNDGLSEE